MIDEKEFFRGATLRICGNLAIEEAMRECVRYIGGLIPLDRMFLQVFEPDLGAMRTLATANAERGEEVDLLTPLAEESRDQIQRHLREENIEIPGVIDVLEMLARRFAMTIVTTAKKDDFEVIHRHRSIVQHMDFVLANGDYPRSKPAPDPYLAALARFGAQPHEAIVVEDSERGLRSAVAAGIDCVVVASEFVRGQDFSAARHRIGSLAELPALLASL